MTDRPVAVIAGIGPGLGSALVRELHGRGYLVAGLARHGTVGEALEDALGERFFYMPADVADAESLRTAIAEAEANYGPIAVYIHNASMLSRKPFLELTSGEFDEVWRVSCCGAMVGASAVLPGMLRLERGTILFTGATAAVRGGAQFGAFASAKFALRGLAQSLAREFQPQGIHVAHVIIDGIILSERAEKVWGMQPEQCLAPASIARQYMALIDQPRDAWSHELDLRPASERF